MRLDDRAADREPHAHPLLLRRVERLEDPVRRPDARAAVPDLGPDLFANATQVDPKSSLARDSFHRLHAIAHQVDQHLLKLDRSEEHTSELQSLMRNTYAVFCLKTKTN